MSDGNWREVKTGLSRMHSIKAAPNKRVRLSLGLVPHGASEAEKKRVERNAGQAAERLARLAVCGLSCQVPQDEDMRWLMGLPTAERERFVAHGLVPADVVAAKRPLREYIERYATELRSDGRDERYVRQVVEQLMLIMKTAGISFLKDVTENRIEVALMKLTKERDWSPGTYNRYQAAASGFFGFCIGQRFYPGPNPMDRVGMKPDDPKDVRRALSATEVTRLLVAVEQRGATAYGLPARVRAILYAVDVGSMLRAAELAETRRMDVHLDGDFPYVHPRSEVQKWGHTEPVYLRGDIAAVLLRYLKEYPGMPEDPLFPDFNEKTGAEMLRDDLLLTGDTADMAREKRARSETPIDPIPYTDSRGRNADFHALRKTGGTLMHIGGIDRETIGRVLRHNHKKRNVTERYIDADRQRLRDAVEAMPSFIPPH